MDAFKITNRFKNVARNIVPNFLTFNKDVGSVTFTTTSGSGSASLSDVDFAHGDRCMSLITSSSIEVNAGTRTRTTAYKGGRYILSFAVKLLSADIENPYLSIKVSKNGSASWRVAEAKEMELGIWTSYFIDFILADKDYLDFSFATNSEFMIDEIGVYCDDRDMMLPPIYSQPYNAMPFASGLVNGVYNVTANSGLNSFTEV